MEKLKKDAGDKLTRRLGWMTRAHPYVLDGTRLIVPDSTSTSVSLTRAEGRLSVEVVDDGGGGAVHDEGMGLSGMRQRVEALGGSLIARPRATGGFEVRVELPL